MIPQLLLLGTLAAGPRHAQDPPPAPDPKPAPAGDHGHEHGDDFASMLKHRAFPELMKWRERHPWRVGSEIRRFVLAMETERSKGDPEIERTWTMNAAFLAEALADDVASAWLITAMNYDVETRAAFDTIRSALADVAASLAGRKDATDASILEEVDSLRPPIAPPWCFESCVEDLTRIAEAAKAAGHASAATGLARQARAIAERTHDGEIALWCATFLGRVEREAGRRTEASEEFRRLLEAARWVERLPPGFDDTLREAATWFGDGMEAVGVDSLRAEWLERDGREEEALALWTKAANSSVPGGVDPARRGALLAARMKRFDRAWELAQIVLGTKDGPQLLGDELDAMLAFLVDRDSTLALWIDGKGTRATVLPLTAERVGSLVKGVQAAISIERPATAFDPAPAREAAKLLLEPLGVPLKGRIGVYTTRELAALPFGALVVADSPRPRFLIEDAVVIRRTWHPEPWKVDEETLSAVGAKSGDALRAVQLEMIENRSPLVKNRTHPWYWVAFEFRSP